MPSFSYNAVDRGGQTIAGTIEGASRQQVIAQLAAAGHFVTEIEGQGGRAKQEERAGNTSLGPSRGPTARQRAAMMRHVATALQAGLPLLAALRVVQEQAESAALGRLLNDLASRVQTGEALSNAMSAHPKVFTPLYVSMARAGETAGMLDQVMDSLADFAEREVEVREKIRSAAMYPAVVLALAVVSVGVILTFIIPRILETVSDTAAVLPLPTRMLMASGEWMRQWWWVAAGLLVGGTWWFAYWIATPNGRLTFDALKLRIPVLGPTLRKLAVGRFARTLGTLCGCGIQILEALRVLRDTLGNEALARQIDEVRSAITQGQSIAEPLRATGQFPPLFIQVIALGERTGRLDELLLRAADSYERETTAAVQRTMTILPAAFIVMLSLLVAFILAAVLLPIVNIQMAVPGM